MITILAVDPSFGASYNVKKAFQTVDETVLLCTHGDKWRKRSPGTIDVLIDESNAKHCVDLVQNSRFVFLVGGSAVGVLERLPGHDEWIHDLNIAAWFTDSFYRGRAPYVNEKLRQWDCNTHFFLPDDTYYSYLPVNSIPLSQPISLVHRGNQPATPITVVHSPGSPSKYKQKGSAIIQQVITHLQSEYNFTYTCLMRLPHEQCLREIAKAHIFVDKLPSDSSGIGIGKSGLEAMASESVLVSAVHSSPTQTYFDDPPVFAVTNEISLVHVLTHLLTHDNLLELGQRSRTWIEKYWGLENGAWMEYFTRYANL